MKKIFGKGGKAILFPFMKGEKLINFETITINDKNKLGTILNNVIREDKLSSRRILLQNLSDDLSKSNGLASYFLATQINTLISSPEIVRKELMDNNGIITPDIREIEDKSLLKLKEYYSTNDSPAVFSTNVKLYYEYLRKVEESQLIDRDDFIKSIKSSGEMLLEEKHHLINIYTLFNKYCNKPFTNLPIETFSINYIYQLFYEFIYEQRRQLTKNQYDEFCKKFGENLIHLSKSFEKRNYGKCYNVLINFVQITNN